MLAAAVGVYTLAWPQDALDGGESASTGSFRSLLASQDPQRCDFTSTQEGMDSEGTVFVAGGKMRGDFRSTVNGTTSGNSMIVEGDTAYIWGESMAQGVKMSLSASTEAQPAGQPQPVDFDNSVDYSCDDWVVNETAFTLPSDVEFVDLAAMMQASGAVNASGTSVGADASAQCAICDSQSEPARSQCRTALSCK